MAKKTAEHHLRKAREQFSGVKDKELADALRRLTTALLRINEQIEKIRTRSPK